ncbi:GNAT family N-acetyltransferase [Plantactinospora solaniradicis]|uniref:GNAT family N-acetyltransferase n=1 Tax=Plantactinospora solaniradicis TaxID=1723736 RepID=A0ABW1KNV5_9ACTN
MREPARILSCVIHDLSIRAVTSSDLEALVSLTGSRDRALVRLQAAQHGDDSMLVAVRSSTVVGVESIRWRDGCDAPHPWLYGLEVAAGLRRQGMGRALVLAAEVLSRQRGAGQLTLDVDTDDDAASAFYSALGYTVARPHRHHWRSLDPHTGAVVAEGYAPTLIMRRALCR